MPYYYLNRIEWKWEKQQGSNKSSPFSVVTTICYNPPPSVTVLYHRLLETCIVILPTRQMGLECIENKILAFQFQNKQTKSKTKFSIKKHLLKRLMMFLQLDLPPICQKSIGLPLKAGWLVVGVEDGKDWTFKVCSIKVKAPAHLARGQLFYGPPTFPTRGFIDGSRYSTINQPASRRVMLAQPVT